MRSRLSIGDWKAGAALVLVAALLVLWLIGLPWPRERPGSAWPGGEPPEAARTAGWLAELVPAAGARGCPRWRELARLGAPDPDASGPLGFEGLRLVLPREQDGVRWTVALLLDAVGESPRAVALRVECTAVAPGAEVLVRRLRDGWPGETSATVAGWVARWRDPRDAAELEGRARAVLGGHRPVPSPGQLADAYVRLLDPLRPVVYAARDGEDAPQGPGRRALEALLAAGRDDLVRNVLRGLDPEGRTYAAEALLERLQREPEDEAALRELFALATPVRVLEASTEGARVTRRTLREALGR